jgi:hypothetical protein
MIEASQNRDKIQFYGDARQTQAVNRAITWLPTRGRREQRLYGEEKRSTVGRSSPSG